MVVVIMFSGGPDSAYLLHHYLVHTHYIVHTHRVDMRYLLEARWEEENRATRDIYRYCREHYRPFSHSTSRYEFPFSAYVGWDSDLFCLIGLRVAANLALRYPKEKVKVALGWTCDSLLRQNVARRIQNNITGNIFSAFHNGLADAFRNHIEEKIEFPIIEMGMSKKDIFLELPEPLWRLSWSCRKPAQGNPCGRCHACELRIGVEKKYGAIKYGLKKGVL